ncbi:uncharacterized protein LOC108098364 isoform X1 [Drosophila ficusphila]|uniref:uncharacterized protein LOC108098364 isoform X1 n=1 Tax=Drosophila ficusphila TaxID=30025 RepID=UPI001C8A582B|nr:uncharacterized protein LOC108098364 isoform X1 [Drosophila ficusphila]
MGSILRHFEILVFLVFLLVYVDSKGNQNHTENDRARHLRPHNLHRNPDQGDNSDTNSELSARTGDNKKIEKDLNPKREKRHSRSKFGLIKEVETVAKMIRTAKQHHSLTPEQKAKLTPHMKKVVLQFRTIFTDIFKNEPDYMAALNMVTNEVLRKVKARTLNKKHHPSLRTDKHKKKSL